MRCVTKMPLTFFRQVALSVCPLDYLMWNLDIFHDCVGFCCKNMENPIICKEKPQQTLRNALRCYATLACH